MKIGAYWRSRENNEDAPYIAFGRRYLGPFLYAYTTWLYDNLLADNIHKVFFIARDGYLMEKAFRILADHNETDFDITYAYFSRKSLMQTMLWRCRSYSDVLAYNSAYAPFPKYVSIGTILRYWGFSEHEREEIVKEHNLNISEEYPSSQLQENGVMEKIYIRLKERINLKSIEQDRLLKQYLEQIGMTGNCAMVDIGWNGRGQHFIEEYSKSNDLYIDCNGYYLGITPAVKLTGQTRGFLYDSENDKRKNAVFAFVGGYEKIFQSAEGTTDGYREENGVIFPDLAPYVYADKEQITRHIREWQNAALAFVEEALDVNRPADPEMAMPLVHLGQYPRLKDVKMFSFLCNDDGKTDYFISQKSMLQYYPIEFIHALRNSVWKTGFMKSVFKLPFPYYFIYWLMRK